MDKKYRTLINVTSKIIVTIICSVWTEQILASNYAPVVDAWQQPQAKNSRYRVNEGDTLYSIAWAFNEDYQDLARANNLKPPYDLRVGQYLNMNITAATSQKQVPKPESESEQKEKINTEQEIVPEREVVPEKEITPEREVVPAKEITPEREAVPAKEITPEREAVPEKEITPEREAVPEKEITPKREVVPEKETQNYTHHAPAIPAKRNQNMPRSEQPLRNTAPNITNSAIKWQWPVRGPLINSANTWLDEKGVNIKSNLGTPVLAAANGQVVYAGSGVKGYGKLIIIKHNDNILSAYALNQSISVHTGSNVHRGDKIATVGCSTSNVCFLHFEIRKNGQAINPRTYLRSKGA
jgi:lipoprotein NlpD